MISPSISDILSAVEAANHSGLLQRPPSGILTGFSGEKMVGALQRLSALFSSDENSCYLEIGVFQGMTLLSTAAANREMACYGIDNFAYLDPDKKNKSMVQERRKKLGADNAHLIDQDYEDALESLRSHIGNKSVAVYFIDGPHDYRSQRMCLDLIVPYLHSNALIIIDDSNYDHVRQANRDFLVTNPEFKLLFDAYTPCHPSNMDERTETEARKGWWNGINIIARDPENRLESMVLPTIRDRSLFENDHLLHPDRLAQEIPKIVQSANKIMSAPFLGRVRHTIQLYRWLNSTALRSLAQRHQSMNTYSGKLPENRINKMNDNSHQKPDSGSPY